MCPGGTAWVKISSLEGEFVVEQEGTAKSSPMAVFNVVGDVKVDMSIAVSHDVPPICKEGDSRQDP